MKRTLLLTLGLSLLAARPLPAGTFDKSPIAPDLGVDALTRGVARAQVGRDVFADPYATVTIGNVDVYDVFPYVESRTFQVVSDPRWNRLVYGEAGRSLKAYDGKGQTLGALVEPRGMSVDERNHVYIADAGNDRIVVLGASTQFGDIALAPLYEIRGLHHPYDVAYSDGGTPFVGGDDVLYVADTGRNRIVAYALGDGGARQVAAVGELGSGPGRFAGPLALTVGRDGGANTRDVFVADAHTQRIVHLRLDGAGLTWVGEQKHDAQVVTSLDTDEWGNLYAAAPMQGVVRKFNAQLVPVAELRDAVARPRGFHIPFVNVSDHRAGTVTRVGKANGLSVDEWTDGSGVRLWTLGVQVDDLRLRGGDAPAAQFTLTDRATVALEITDAATGRVLSRRAAGVLDAGAHEMTLQADEIATAAGASSPVVRLTAASSYTGGASAFAQAAMGPGGGPALPAHPVLLAPSPNPVRTGTRLAFLLPSGGGRATLGVFDASGRRIRTFAGAFAPGRNEVAWDGNDERGARVAAGVYFSKLEIDRQAYTRRMVVVR